MSIRSYSSFVVEWDSDLGLSNYRVKFMRIVLHWLPYFASPIQFRMEIEVWEENE